MSLAGRRPGDEHAVELGPIKSTRIYEEIVRQVKQLIAEGRFKSGDRLPPERELAEKFVVSRTSVREALRALESLGLIDIRPGEGIAGALGHIYPCGAALALAAGAGTRGSVPPSRLMPNGIGRVRPRRPLSPSVTATHR